MLVLPLKTNVKLLFFSTPVSSTVSFVLLSKSSFLFAGICGWLFQGFEKDWGTMLRFTLSSAVSVLSAFTCYIVNSSRSSTRKVSDNKMILLFSLCNKFHFVNVKYFVTYIALRFERQLRKYLLAYPILLMIYF